MNDILILIGTIVEGDKTIQQMGEEILEYCIKAASGEIIPKAVQLNQDDFIHGNVVYHCKPLSP
jgi:altronate hydrolase